MILSDCPAEEALRRYAAGALSDGEANTIDTHLLGCTVCLGRLDSVASHADPRNVDPVVAALRRPAGPVASDSPALAQAVAAVLTDNTHPTDLPASEAAIGTVVGGYQILEHLGHGGMGRVYRARHPRLDQEVALKVLRPGFDSAKFIARFEAERQTLALMDHPHIARVSDGGVTHDGQPYFVMELVHGTPITGYCKDHGLDLPRRLELFIQVCQAVQHAHQKEMIHRDLKPSNILVAEYDGKPAPKIIDFGIAKAVAGRSAAETEFGMLVGTPEYMSPEQAGLRSRDMDTRSDIYALGVLLYELLTGDTPLARERVHALPVLEVLRLIREEDPPAPSHSRTASKQVRGELDWIVLRALDKDRARRYETAAALGEDVRRFLRNEPVAAGPPGRAYRLRKFVHRNRGAVIAVTLIVASLVSGIVGTTAAMVHANRERDEKQTAFENLDKEQQHTQAALNAETQARRQAMKALRSMTDDVIERQLARQVTLSNEDRAFLQNIVTQYEAFAAVRGEREENRGIRAEAYLRVGRVRQRLGELAEALACYQRSEDLFRQLVADYPSVSSYRRELAACHHNVGCVLPDLGRNAEAVAEFRQAIGRFTQLAADFPAEPGFRRDLARGHGKLAELCKTLGKYPEATEEYRHGQTILKQLAADFPREHDYRWGLAQTQNNLGYVLGLMGKHEQAEVEHGLALTHLQQLVAESPAVPTYRQDLATSRNNFAARLADRGKRPEAELEHRAVLVMRKQLAADFPSWPEYRHELAASHNTLGNLYAAQKNEEAEAELQFAMALHRQLAADFPAVPKYRQALAHSCNSMGIMWVALKKYTEAEAAYNQALALRKKLATDHGDVPEHAVELGGSYCNMGNLLKARGKWADTLPWYQQAIETLSAVAQTEPPVANAREFLRNGHWGHAMALQRLQRYAEALENYESALPLSDGSATVALRFGRAYCLAHLEPEKGVGAVEALIKGSTRANDPYLAACVCAVASGKVSDSALREEFAVRAVTLLRQARGFLQMPAMFQQMQANQDFGPLRQREDFKKLVAELSSS